MGNLGLGFLAGFFANFVFRLIARMLPATWVRYMVRIGNPKCEKDLAGSNWIVPVTIAPPRWKRLFMDPLKEYLIAELSLDDTSWINTKWDIGDIANTMLRVDGAMSVPVILLCCSGSTGCYLGDRYLEQDYIIEQLQDLHLRIVRSLDGSIADKVKIPAELQEGSWKLIGTLRS